MPRPTKFFVGQKYGRLTAIARTGASPKAAFQCECGVIKELWVGHVTSGRTNSCGCLHTEFITQLGKTTKHGMYGTKTYGVWSAMKSRCANPEHAAYQNYGARGVTICKRWMSFKNFYADMGEQPPGMTLERKNNERGYMPSNCIWAPHSVQQNNKRSNVQLRYNGRTQNVTQWATELGINRFTIYDRLKAGWSVKRALTEPRGPTGPRK